MISRVTIANYKSVENADFEARRVNVFIGEPNSGKSNVLEALAFASPGVLPILRELFRIQQTADLFFDREIEREIRVLTQGGGQSWQLKFNQQVGNFTGGSFTLNPQGQTGSTPFDASPLRFYRYRALQKGQWDSGNYGRLQPPYGSNLPTLLYTSKGLRESISSFFKSKGFRLELRPQDNEILMSKEVDDVLYSFPFESISETMRRIVFYKAALESNKDAVLVLDEPEANTFPFYTKYLAERIALDTSNQFFLSTHNPYVLMSIIEKTSQSDLAVYVTRMSNYRTEMHLLGPEQCASALELGMDLFLNLDQFFPQ
ncbi:MAG TPA: AAA family ATPase [Chthoniobacteraceae bacterium]|nr:AAA family ATPase [Chthoniobacteraceae bacterium]